MSISSVVYIALLLTTCIACATDLRSGLIPNRLTLSVLLLAPIGHGLSRGWPGLIESLAGAFACGFVPLLFYRMGAMGGGDVKLFAALGALAGPTLGLEIELTSLGLTALWSVCVLAYRGRLWASLRNSVFLLVNMVLPESKRRPMQASDLTSLRIGAAIFLGTLLAVANRALLLGVLP
jgi:prepilin peptidase CpaA